MIYSTIHDLEYHVYSKLVTHLQEHYMTFLNNRKQWQEAII